MAVLHADNFSIYGSNATISLMLNGVYAGIDGCQLAVDPDGLSPGFVLKPGWNGVNNNNDNWRYAFQSGPQDTCGVALRQWLTALPGGSDRSNFITARTSGNATMASVSVDSTGTLTVHTYNKSDGSVLNTYTTPIPVLTATGWYHVEFKYTHADLGLCSFELRVEGQTVLSEDDVPDGGWQILIVVDPPTYQVEQVAQVAASWSQIAHPAVYYIKDLVIWDGEGSQNNDFLGSVLVTELAPTSDVELNWTPSTGSTGYTILDNIPPNDGIFLSAPYSPTDPHFPDPYVATMSDLPADATSVKAIITYVRAAKSDGGDGSLQVGIISDPEGTPATVLGADRPITVAQTYWRDVFEVDPKTSAPWLPSAVNDAEIQINRTT